MSHVSEQKLTWSSSELGWSAFFANQVTEEEREDTVPGRVFSVQRSGITVVTESGSADVPVGGRWFQQEPEARPAIGDWVLLDASLSMTAGAGVDIVDILPLSIANALYHQSPERVGSQLVIHLSSDYATLVVAGIHPLYSRYIPLGTGEDKLGFAFLDRELLKSLTFIEREYPDVSMGGFHLMGNHPGLADFARHLEEATGQDWETIDRLKAYGPQGQPKGKYELALSLALRDGRSLCRN